MAMAVIVLWLLFVAAGVLLRKKRARVRECEVRIQLPIENAGSEDACRIGVALAVLFSKIVDTGKFSEAELRRLAQAALQESLSPVLGGRAQFECLGASFEETYRVIRKVDAAEIHMDENSSIPERFQDSFESPAVSFEKEAKAPEKTEGRQGTPAVVEIRSSGPAAPAVVKVHGAREVLKCPEDNVESPAANVCKDSPRVAVKDCKVQRLEVENSAESVQSAVRQSEGPSFFGDSDERSAVYEPKDSGSPGSIKDPRSQQFEATLVDVLEDDLPSSPEPVPDRWSSRKGSELLFIPSTSKAHGGLSQAALVAAVKSVQLRERSVQIQERKVAAKERSNDIKYLELFLAKQRTQMKQEEISLASEANSVAKQRMAFKIAESHDQVIAAGCLELCRTCADDFVAGLILMLTSMCYCSYKHIPLWLAELKTTCMPPSRGDKSGFLKLLQMKWLLSAAEGHGRFLLCMLKGTAGLVAGVGVSILVIMLVFRRLLGSPNQGMPSTIFLVGGCLAGLAGKFIIDLLGGDGLRWLIFWGLICLMHALSNYFAVLLFGLLQHKGRKFIFHGTLGFVLPMAAAIAAFPTLLPKYQWQSNSFELSELS